MTFDGQTTFMSPCPQSLLGQCLSLPLGSSSRPHVTVTWAQSLDAKIAGPKGARVLLSGPESMEMTHWLRAMHDAILIGINTLINDDPRLKVQLLPQDDPTLNAPQPLILDPRLRFPLSARILSEWNTHKGQPGTKVRQPWIVSGDKGVDPERVRAVEDAGARVVQVPLASDGRISANDLPSILTRLGLKSVMIEGGSMILSSFLHAPPRTDGTPLVDSVVVTVAPTFIGDGVGVVPQGHEAGLPRLRTLRTETMGKDAVMICAIES